MTSNFLGSCNWMNAGALSRAMVVPTPSSSIVKGTVGGTAGCALASDALLNFGRLLGGISTLSTNSQKWPLIWGVHDDSLIASFWKAAICCTGEPSGLKGDDSPNNTWVLYSWSHACATDNPFPAMRHETLMSLERTVLLVYPRQAIISHGEMYLTFTPSLNSIVWSPLVLNSSSASVCCLPYMDMRPINCWQSITTRAFNTWSAVGLGIPCNRFFNHWGAYSILDSMQTMSSLTVSCFRSASLMHEWATSASLMVGQLATPWNARSVNEIALAITFFAWS